MKFLCQYGLPLLITRDSGLEAFYIKRLKANVFYDHGLGINNGDHTLYRSAGSELVIEWHPFSNKMIALNSALRYSRCFDTGENKYEFVLMLQ